MGLELDQEFLSAVTPLIGDLGGFEKPKPHDVEGRRNLFGPFFTPIGPASVPKGVAHTILRVSTSDGYQQPVYHFKREVSIDSKPGPALVHIHGGGFIMGTPENCVERLSKIVLETGVQVFSPDYRLAPEKPYPTPLDDCWCALTWVLAHASELGIDPSRVAVMGESAGANLATAMTLRARDRGLSPPIAMQLLSAPMLDDRNAEKMGEGFTIWDHEDNLTGWTAYLGEQHGGENVPIFAAPGRIKDAKGLPPLYLEVGQLDLFVKENMAYVRKFVEAGVRTEFHLYPGLPHGFEQIAPMHSATKESKERIYQLLKSL